MAIGGLAGVPELQAEGIARIEAVKPGNLVSIRFLRSGAEMTQESARLVRYVLLPRTRVQIRQDDITVDAVVTGVLPRAAGEVLLTYSLEVAGQTGITATEADIVAVPPSRDPAEQLLTLAFHDLTPRFDRMGRHRSDEPWGPAIFCAREQLLRHRDAVWSDLAGVVGLAGARVVPLPHQFLIASRALADREVRFLLADEVGLGKTIETGLILQSLWALRPNLRVLIIAPGALISQWFVEFFVRFGGRRFLMLDDERIRARRGNVWEEEDRLLVSARAVEELSGAQALRFAKARWDVVVVDECHRMQPQGPLYKRMAILSKNTPHVLLLSATPGRQHPDASLALLHLLAPDAYRLEDGPAFTTKLAAHAQVLDLAERCRAPEGDPTALAAAWRSLLGSDAQVAIFADAVVNGDPQALEHLVAYAIEHYGLDHRVLGCRRRTLQAGTEGHGLLHLAERSREMLPYTMDPGEVQIRAALAGYTAILLQRFAAADTIPPRLVHWLLQLHLAVASHPLVLERLLKMRATVLEDPEAFEEYRLRAHPAETLSQVLRADLSETEAASHIAISASCHVDPAVEAPAIRSLIEALGVWAKHRSRRLEALAKRLQCFWKERPDEKVLVFTANPVALRPVAAALVKDFPTVRVLEFGAHQETVEREEAARLFEHDDRCALMVSDPLGGEGRNFQFVSVVVHLDLPWSLAAVEQRIGRVDRLGRDGEVPSWVLLPDTADAHDTAWAQLLDTGVQAFTHPSSGLEFVADRVEGEAAHLVLRGGGAALVAALPGMVALLAEERQRVETDRDDLTVTPAALARAAETLAVLTTSALSPEALGRWARGAGGSSRSDEDGRTHFLRLPGGDQPVQGTFDRDLALARPSLAFFADGNAMVDSLVDDAIRADWCRATAWRRCPTPACRSWEGLRVTLAWEPDLVPLAVAGLSIDLIRRLITAAPSPRLTVFVRTTDGQEEEEEGVLAVLTPPFDDRMDDTVMSQRQSRDAWTRALLDGKGASITSWQAGVDRAITAATDCAHARSEAERRRVAAIIAVLGGRQVALADARATAAVTRFGRGHPDAERLRHEADAERQLDAVLRAMVAGAAYRIASLALIVVG